MKICENCTGCASCLASCPVSAISMVQSEEGFYIPVIDENKCINCGLCKKICPQNSYEEKELEYEQKCYAAVYNNDIALKSSSGGMFTLLSEYVLEKNGYVCGAAFSDDFKKVEHIIVDNKNDLEKLRVSKYLQSYVGDIYKKIKELLDNDNYVLFSGTPCQVSGLKSYLRKDYEKLLTVDIVCHGVPSPKVWERYLEEISNGRKVISASFRSKSKGWAPALKIEYSDGSILEEDCVVNIYFQAFLKDLICNKTCGKCKYTNLNRQGDVTIGDFWKIEEKSKVFENKNGVSLVLLNNKKFIKDFEDIKDKILVLEKRPLEDALSSNSVLEMPCDIYPYRQNFFQDMNKYSVIENIKEKLNKKYDGIITNFWFCGNYGAVISAYAVQKFLKECGFDYHILNYTRYSKADKIAKNFSVNHLKLTHRVSTLVGLYQLNNYSDNFVVGTDQIFRYMFIKDDLPHFTLSYTDFDKKRVAFSASFGKDKFDEVDILTHFKVSKYLNRFDYLSTREISGVDLCKKEFGISAEHIIDPVFLLDKKYWEKLIEEASDKSYKGKILSYILDESEIDSEIYSYLEKKYDRQIEIIKEGTVSVQEFLKAFSEADFVITDSFHGTCFSMIFGKKFVTVINKIRGGARFDSIIKTFNIEENFVNEKADILKIDDVFKGFDLENFEKVIAQGRIKARDRLTQVLSSPKKITKKQLINEKIYNGINFLDSKFEYTMKKIPDYLEEISLLKILFKYRNKKIAFWGASIFLGKFLEKYNIKNKNIIAVIDKDSSKQGDELFGYEIISPEKIEEKGVEKIIFTIKNKHHRIYPMVKKYLDLYNKNVELEKDFFKEV